jgi:repressor LexA
MPKSERERLTERQREVLDFIQAKIQRDGYPPTIREIGDQLGIRSTNGVNDHLKALAKKGYLQRTEAKSRACVPTNAPVADDKRLARRYLGEDKGRGDKVKRPTLAGVDPTALIEAAGASAPIRGLAAVEPPRAVGRIKGDVEIVDYPHNDDDEVDVPVLGRIAAGQPILALEREDDTVRIDRMFLGKRNDRDVFALRVVGESMIEDGINDGDFIFVRKQREAPRGAIVVALIEDEATVKRFYPEGDKIRFQPSNSAMKPIYVSAKDFKQTHILGVVVGIYRRMD